MQLDQERITSQLADCALGHTLFYYESVPSTMPIAHELANDPAIRSGTVVVAEEQTAGRGRHDRRWETPTGQALLMSFIFKAPFPVAPAYFPMLASLAMIGGISASVPALAPYLGLKWPNDLLLGTGMADAGKTGGILIESRYRGASTEAIIVGCGINVLQTAATLPTTPPGAPAATSLQHFCQTQPALVAQPPALDRSALFIQICHQWAQLYTDPHLSPSTLQQQWAARLWTLQQPVIVQSTNERGAVVQIQGRATAVTADGQLVVETAAGERHCFAAGDVSLRRASG